MEHVKNMDCFSVTMADVPASMAYAMALITVAITVMN